MKLRAAACLALVLGLAGCGGHGRRPKVFAASSLTVAFGAYGRSLPARPAFSFAGSDQLAAQLREGVRPDVFAAANAELPLALFREGLVERPVPFATNELVIGVPADGGRVKSVADLEGAGVRLAVGSRTVPVGTYTRETLARLGPAGRRILANVRSEEPDVGGVLGKLEQGAVDAGFVYRSDVRSSGGRLRAIQIPTRARPRVIYEAAVVRGAPNRRQAREFLAGLLRGKGQRALRSAGLDPPPR